MGLAGRAHLHQLADLRLRALSGHVVEASLGYFINPIVTVFLGVLFLRERLRLAQWIAVGVSLLAVVVLAIGYGNRAVDRADPRLLVRLLRLHQEAGRQQGRRRRRAHAWRPLWLMPVAIVQLVVVGATAGLTIGTVSATAHGVAARRRRRHRRSAALLRRGVTPTAADLHGLHPVPRARSSSSSSAC